MFEMRKVTKHQDFIKDAKLLTFDSASIKMNERESNRLVDSQ